MGASDDKKAYFRAKIDRIRAENRAKAEAKGSAAMCTQCGAALQAGVKFCGACGTKVEQAQFCTQCGAKMAPGTKFCGDCGQQRGTAAAPSVAQAPPRGQQTSMQGTLCCIDFAKIRKDWDEARFGGEVSFWSQEEERPLFVDGRGTPLQDNARYAFNLLKNEDGLVLCLLDPTGKVLVKGAFLDSVDAEEAIKNSLQGVFSLDDEQLSDMAYLLLNADSPDEMSEELACKWISTLGEGSQLYVGKNVAGGLFVEVAPPAEVNVAINADGTFEYDGDEVSDARDESLRFVGVMLK